jgi:hypothetical protein
MPPSSIIYPAFAQVLLTFVVLVIMGVRRSASMREKKHNFKDVALGQDVWAVQATKAARNFTNQFEVPVLFYAACAMGLAAGRLDQTFVGLAWAFVATRTVHAFIHLWPNKVPMRALAFLIGAIIVLAMWVVLVMRVS